MKIYKLFIVLNVVFSLIIGCKKNNSQTSTNPNSQTNQPIPPHNCPPTNHYNIDTFLIQNFLFNTGSYWVYFDSLNNTFDSCYLIQPEKLIFTYYEGSPGDVCTYNWRYALNHTTNMLFQYSYFLQGNNINLAFPLNYLTLGMIAIKLCSTYNGSFISDSNSTFYPYYLIDTVSYSNVYRFRFQGNGKPSYPDSGYCYLKNRIGIIKSELYYSGQKKTYKLMRCHIQ